MIKYLSLLSALFVSLSCYPAAAETAAYAELEAAAPAFQTEVHDSIISPSPLDRTAPSQALAYTRSRAQQLAAAAGQLTQVNFMNGGMNGQDQYYYWGAPASVKLIQPAKVGIMRHWTSNAQADGIPVVDLIVKSSLLKAGPRPYIIPESHRADYYQELHGVFFTTPDFAPGQLWMGLRPDSDFVDFVVDPGMGTLYLAPGNYLFPCPLKVQDWIADAYKKWKASGVMPGGMELTFKQIDREGGLLAAIDIPVTVVQYQKNNKITVLRPDLLKKPY